MLKHVETWRAGHGAPRLHSFLSFLANAKEMMSAISADSPRWTSAKCLNLISSKPCCGVMKDTPSMVKEKDQNSKDMATPRWFYKYYINNHGHISTSDFLQSSKLLQVFMFRPHFFLRRDSYFEGIAEAPGPPAGSCESPPWCCDLYAHPT